LHQRFQPNLPGEFYFLRGWMQGEIRAYLSARRCPAGSLSNYQGSWALSRIKVRLFPLGSFRPHQLTNQLTRTVFSMAHRLRYSPHLSEIPPYRYVPNPRISSSPFSVPH